MKFKSALIIGALALANCNLWASARQDTIERLHMASNVLLALTNTPDKGIPEDVMNSAKCIVVFPHLLKAGFIFGGEHGRGVATCRTSTGWSAPAFVSIGGGSWGLQIGVEGIDLVMLVMNDHGLQHLLTNKFELGGDASASAGPVGRETSASTSVMANSEILTYSRSRGAFAGITLDGSVVEQDHDSTDAIYGHNTDFHRVLAGDVKAPASTLPFLHTVAMVSHKSEVAEGK